MCFVQMQRGATTYAYSSWPRKVPETQIPVLEPSVIRCKREGTDGGGGGGGDGGGDGGG